MIQKETPSLILGPSRKSRTKIRKPKFLSLRLALSPESTQHSGEIPADHHHQLNLFPLHPENLVEDHKDTRDDDVAYFFSAADGGATTLTGLLDDGTASSSAFDVDSCNNVTNSTTTTLSTPESLTYAYGGQDMEEGDQQLVRTAMRNKERDPTSEEKWVCYSEVTDSSGGVSVSDLRWKSDEEKMIQLRQKRLSLKLDYEEIMNVWCDNIHLEYSSSSSQPQVVPDFHDDDLFGRPTTSNGWGTNGGLWKVPEMSGSNSKGCVKMEEVRGEECKMAQREASVSRYKEKRQNRLFSKKIRYQVRKLNAEKRPRIKGRFVRGKKLSE